MPEQIKDSAAAESKIKAEISANANNPYTQVVGNFLLQQLATNPGAAEQILAEGKTIKGSLDEMQKEARKKQVGNCAVLTDQEGFAIVLKYYGIKAGSEPQGCPSAAPAVPVKPPAQGSDIDFDVRLDDLL